MRGRPMHLDPSEVGAIIIAVICFILAALVAVGVTL